MKASNETKALVKTEKENMTLVKVENGTKAIVKTGDDMPADSNAKAETASSPASDAEAEKPQSEVVASTGDC